METFASWTIKIILVILTVFFTIYGEQALCDKNEGKKVMNLIEFLSFLIRNGREMARDIAIPVLAITIVVAGYVVILLIFTF